VTTRRAGPGRLAAHPCRPRVCLAAGSPRDRRADDPGRGLHALAGAAAAAPGIGVCLIFAVLLGGLPLILTLEPGLADVHVLGIPLPWLLLGVVVYPVLLGAAWLYVRQAERNERDFAELVQ
jgi:hypothetical protein